MPKSRATSQNLRQTEHQSAELAAMRRMLSVSRGTSSLSIAICNSPALRDYLIAKLKEQTKPIEVVQITEDTTDVFNLVNEKVPATFTGAIFITEIEKLLSSDKKEHKILKALNASRELWKATYSCPIVFWMPEYAATLFSVQARDLWSWLSHQFEYFSEEAHIPAGMTDAFAGDILAAGNLEADQKRFRIAELEQRIEEAGSTQTPEVVQHVLIWLNELAYVYTQLGDLAQAESNIRKSLEIKEKLGLKEMMANDYGNLGVIYQTRGEFDEAKQMFEKILKIHKQLGSKVGMAKDYGSLGLIYRKRGELDEAEQMHKKSLAIAEDLGLQEGMAREYGNLGLIYMTRGELDEAEEMLKKSLALNEKLWRLEGMAVQYGNLGLIYRTRGKLDEAEEMHKKSLAIAEKLGRIEGMANQYVNLGAVYEGRGADKKAREYWEKAAGLFGKIGIPHKMERVQGLIEELGKEG